VTFAPDLFERMGLAPAAPAIEESSRRRVADEDQRLRAEDDRAERVANKALQPSFLSALEEDADELGDELAELEETPIAFDENGVCTQHQSPCPRFLCPRNLMFDFGDPFVDARGRGWAPVTLNTGVEEGRRGRRSSWTIEEQADESNWRDMANQAIERFESLRLAEAESRGAGELCAAYIALGIRRVIEAFEKEAALVAETIGEGVDPDELRRVKLERRRQLDELTVVQLAAKMGVSDETLRLLTVDSFAKIRAAAVEGGWTPKDGFDAFAVIEAVLRRG
jgi:hypothetical protein